MRISKNQYHDIMALMDAMNRMWSAEKYRKYRPPVPVHGNANIWYVISPVDPSHPAPPSERFAITTVPSFPDFRVHSEKKTREVGAEIDEVENI